MLRAIEAALESLEAYMAIDAETICMPERLAQLAAARAEHAALLDALEAGDKMQAETCEACGAVYPVCQEHITCRTTFAYRAARARVQL